MNIIGIVGAATLLLAGSAAAQDGGKVIPKTTITLGTATPGGGFPLYGNAFAEVMNETDPTLSIEPRNTKGSNENIPLLEEGKLDIALVAGEPSYEAFMGIGRPATRLKILTAMYSSPGMFVVRADSPYKTIRDLVGKPVAFGAKGSGLPILSRYLLDGLGTEAGRGFPVDLSRPRRRWTGDGAGWTGRGVVGRGHRLAGIQDHEREPGWGAVHRPGRRRNRAHPAKHTFLKPLTIPAGSYPTQSAPINSLGSWSFILARENLPDDVAYRLAKSLHSAESPLCKKLPQACETTAANTVAAAPKIELIHPGVLKYFREIGVAK